MSDDGTESADREGRLDEAVAAYLQAAEAGRAPDRREWLARYPDVAGELEHFFAGNERFDRLAAPLRLLAPAVSGVTGGDGASGLGRLGDFQLMREVGRGGMGVVYEAEQISLGRRVALKILSCAATRDPRHLQRFENEARAAASLHHPNIVPVYAVGCDCGVRFYAMQFVDGQTLAELISAQWQERPSPSPTQPHIPASVAPTLLAAAKTTPKAQETTPKAPPDAAYYRRVAGWGVQAAEALEHAHGLGIIHRDVKPGNLMIDGGGKLWVTDFGLARVAADAGLTMTGDVLGTLRYMSPEQALAKHGLMDHRTDVYSLGATLYELATFKPAVSGKDRGEIFRRITLEDPTPPCALDRTVPAELEVIILKALAKEPQERYATAQELADDLRRWLEDRAILARRPSLYQRLRKWGRRHRVVVTAAAVCLLVTLTAVAGSGGWVLGDRATRQREAEARVLEALEAAAPGLQQGNPQDPGLITAEQRAAAQLNTGAVGSELQGRAEQLRRDLDMLRRLENARLQSAAGSRETGLDYVGADQLYAQAFKEYGLDLAASSPRELAARIRVQAIRTPLVTALDEWAWVRNQLHPDAGTPLGAVAALADDDPWRQRLREAATRGDRVTLEGLAKGAELSIQPPGNLVLLANALAYRGSGAAAERLLLQAQQEHPGNFWINFDLGVNLLRKKPPDHERAARFFQAALALRSVSPVVYVNLACALHGQGKLAEAEAACRKAIALKPDLAEAHNNLGVALRQQGKSADAEAAYRRATQLMPDNAEAHANLGTTLADQGKLAEAVAPFRKAIALKPDFAMAHNNLGRVLQEQGRFADALAALKRGHELGSRRPAWPYPSAQWVRAAAQLAVLDDKLPRLLSGEAQPADASEGTELARLCQMPCKSLYAAAVRFYTDAFAAQPKLADDLTGKHRYNAACAAALAGCGQGKDAGNLDDKERARLRHQALDWLRADLTARRRLLDKGPEKERPVMVQQVRHWLQDDDLAGVRDKGPLDLLPAAERRAWQQLWADVSNALP